MLVGHEFYKKKINKNIQHSHKFICFLTLKNIENISMIQLGQSKKRKLFRHFIL